LLGEELRLLYVAMTRARDTLLLTALDTTREGEPPWKSGRIDSIAARELLAARSYWDWLKKWLARATQPGDWKSDRTGNNELLTWRRWTKPELTLPKKFSPIAVTTEATALPAFDVDDLRQRVSWQYAFAPATTEMAKSNVSALRRRAAELDDESSWLFVPPPRAKRSAVLSATDVGSAHHAFLQRVNLQRVSSLLELRGEAERFVADGWLTREEAKALDYEALLRFWQSADGRTVLAQAANVHRELPFTTKFTVEELRELGLTRSSAKGEFVIVQGVVDLAVIREQDIDLFDFKTDQVTRDSIKAKEAEYRPQLRLYAAALRAIYRRPVRKAALHFLAVGETLPISAGEI
jgi:ATP-dependent helicase/nuclease subunit A